MGVKTCHPITTHVRYKKTLGLTQATFAGVGIILGAGIYALIGEAAGLAGNSVWISFLIAAFVAACTGLSYAELSSMFSSDASEYIYAEKAFTQHWGFIVAFLVIFQGIVSAAAVALGFGGYLAGILSMNTTIAIVGFGLLCVFGYSLINYFGIKQSIGLNILFTIIETGGLLLIIGIGLGKIGSVNLLTLSHGYKGILSGSALIFFSYIGFESIVKLSEETKNAKKTIPKALIYSIIISTVIYVLVAISAVSILGWEKLAASSAPLADVASAVFGSNAFLLLAIIALFSTSNTVLMILVTTARMIQGVARKYDHIKMFSKINAKRRTPTAAVILTMITTMLLVVIGDIKVVAEMTDFSIFATFIIINLSLIVLRYKKKQYKRVFKVPLNIGRFPIIPAIGVITSILLLFHLPLHVNLYGLVLIGIGFGIYYMIRGSVKPNVIITDKCD